MALNHEEGFGPGTRFKTGFFYMAAIVPVGGRTGTDFPVQGVRI